MKCRKLLGGDCIKGEKSILHGLYIQAGFAVAGTLLFLLLLLWARDFKTAVLLLVDVYKRQVQKSTNGALYPTRRRRRKLASETRH